MPKVIFRTPQGAQVSLCYTDGLLQVVAPGNKVIYTSKYAYEVEPFLKMAKYIEYVL